MKRCNSIEEYNDEYRKHLKKTWETEVRLCQNWLDGHRSYWKCGYLADMHSITEKDVKKKLDHANKILNNIEYYVQRHSYKYKKPHPQKDNDLSFVGEGSGLAHSSKIRVPSLKRKTAWKRFYKMFPNLKGMKTISGKSSCYIQDKEGRSHSVIPNKSTIKLKKVK